MVSWGFESSIFRQPRELRKDTGVAYHLTIRVRVSAKSAFCRFLPGNRTPATRNSKHKGIAEDC